MRPRSQIFLTPVRSENVSLNTVQGPHFAIPPARLLVLPGVVGPLAQCGHGWQPSRALLLGDMTGAAGRLGSTG